MFQGKYFANSRKKVTSLTEYINHVEYAQTTFFNGPIWFRGHANVDFKLLPNILRIDELNRNLESDLKEDFSDKVKGFVNSSNLSEFELYYLMQHYGFKTRLLDWTEGSLIALFFSLRLNVGDNPNMDSCVWMMNPIKLNQISLGIGRLIRTKKDHDDFSKYAEKYLKYSDIKEKRLPIAITSSYSNERILRQKGCFTIHGDVKKDIQYIFGPIGEPNLVKIRISRKHTKQIKEQLQMAGISESSLFPDLEGLSRELNEKYFP